MYSHRWDLTCASSSGLFTHDSRSALDTPTYLMPSIQSQEYIIEAENLRRSSSNESILLSLKLTTTMSHDDHFHYGCFGRPSRRSPNVAGNNNSANNNSARRGFFSSGGRTVLPPLHLPFRTSRSPGLCLFSHAHATRTLTVVPMQLLIQTLLRTSSVNKTQHNPAATITYQYMTSPAGQLIPVSPPFPTCTLYFPLTASQ